MIAVCYLGEPQKKSFECHSREQKTAFSELTFELASMLSLQWFCKSVIPDSTYFELKVLRAECVSLESHKKKNLLTVAARNREGHFQSYLSNWLQCITLMILQNTNSRFNLFLIASFDSWVCWLGEPRKKICWLSQQGTEKSIFRVIFRIGFDVINAMILQNTISRFNFFRIASLIAECVSLVSHEKISVDCRS